MINIPGKVQTLPTVYIFTAYCALLAIVMKKYLVKCRLGQVYNIYCILSLEDVTINKPGKVQAGPSIQYLLHIVLYRCHDKYTW